MKTVAKLALVLCAGFVLSGCATGVNVTSSQYQKEQTFESEKEQDQLYVAINDWLSQALNSREAAVQFTDKEAGKISARITTQGVPCRLDTAYLTANWTFDVKDQAYRVRVNPIHMYSQMADTEYTSVKKDCMEKLNKEVESTIQNLESHVSSYQSF